MYSQPYEIVGFHGCDKDVGLKVLNGNMDLAPSRNPWDWLGEGIYFWEQNPLRALKYAEESALGVQFNKTRIQTPFIIGTTIKLGNCLNLVEPESLAMLEATYDLLSEFLSNIGNKMPFNNGANRSLDCAVIKCLHTVQKEKGLKSYDTIRSAFAEGKEIYPTAPFTSGQHIQVCVLNPGVISGYFLPRPLEKFNPYLFRQSA